MSFNRLIPVLRPTVQRIVVRSGHGGPLMPPFARLRPPSGTVRITFSKLPEEVELVWDDSVAPETAIDFDAPHVSNKDALLSFMAAFGFFGIIYSLVALSDPVARNPVAVRASVIDHAEFRAHMGVGTEKEE